MVQEGKVKVKELPFTEVCTILYWKLNFSTNMNQAQC